GTASQVEHAFRNPRAVFRRPELERLQQLRLDIALQGRRLVVAARGARKRAPDLAAVEVLPVRAWAVHSRASRNASRRNATASAWVRNGAWPACSMTSNSASGVSSAAA